MKAAAIVILCLAVVVAVIPQFTDCQSQGKAIELPNGKTVPMKCHWTARAEVVVAVPMALCGVGMLLSRRRQLWRQQAVMAAVLGVFVALLPTALIGVCMKADMVCHALMRPVLTLAGILAIATGVLCFVLASRAKE